MGDSAQSGATNIDNMSAVPDNVDTNPVTKKEGSNTNNWPGGWFIVKRSIIDFFTNIVPWLVGLLAIVPLVMAFAIMVLFSRGNLYINIFAFIVGIIGVIALFFVAICSVGSTPVYGLARADGNKMSTRDFYTYRSNIFWRLLGAQILLGLAILAGFIFLIIPGIILAIWLLPALVLVPYVIVEEKLGVVDSIKRAHQLGKGHAGKVWGIVGWYLLIGMIFLIPIIILIVIILSQQAHAATKDTMLSNSSSSGSSGSSGGGFGGSSPLAAISFAYLYRWIKQQPEVKS